MRSRRQWLTGALIVLIAIAVPMISSSVDAAQREDKFLDSFVLILDFEYCWQGVSCGNSTMYLTLDRTFTTDEGTSGTWDYFRASSSVEFVFQGGCFPVYEGRKVAPRTWAGTMTCTDGFNDSGTWNAVLTGISRATKSSSQDAGSMTSPPAN